MPFEADLLRIIILIAFFHLFLIIKVQFIGMCVYALTFFFEGNGVLPGQLLMHPSEEPGLIGMNLNSLIRRLFLIERQYSPVYIEKPFNIAYCPRILISGTSYLPCLSFCEISSALGK